MAEIHILIVDDHRDARRMLRAAVETLSGGIRVSAVPSGEEAMLVIAHEPVDVLVSDVHLPGISGLELRRRAQAHKPGLKVVLITGVADAKIRKQVAEAGAEAYFFKPVEMAAFLEAVQRCLGVAAPVNPPTPGDVQTLADPLSPSDGLSDRLSKLRQEISAICTLLLDDRGRVLAQAGDLPDGAGAGSLIPALMETFSAGGKFSHFLGMKSPQDRLFFRGAKFDLLMAHAGASRALLLLSHPGQGQDWFAKAVNALDPALQDLLTILAHKESPGPALEEHQPGLDAGPIVGGASTGEASPELDLIFSAHARQQLNPEEIDSFWENLDAEHASPDAANAENILDDKRPDDGLSYEQARRLGLAPEEDGEE